MDAAKRAKTYTRFFIELMTFIDGVQHDASASFTCNEILAITSKQVTYYLSNKAYNIAYLYPEDHPHRMRAASHEFQKMCNSCPFAA